VLSSIVSCVRTTLDLIPTFFGLDRVNDWRVFIRSTFSFRMCVPAYIFEADDAPRRPSQHTNSAVAAFVESTSNTEVFLDGFGQDMCVAFVDMEVIRPICVSHSLMVSTPISIIKVHSINTST